MYTLSREDICEIRRVPRLQDWEELSWCPILNEDFIDEFDKYLNWSLVSYYQPLSEKMIEKKKHRVNWYYISLSQSLSEDFMISYSPYICIDALKINKYAKFVSYRVAKHFKPHLNKAYINMKSLIKIQRWALMILYKPKGRIYEKTKINYYKKMLTIL